MGLSAANELLALRLKRIMPAIARDLPGRNLQHYLGNGKDGYVFRMYDPSRPDDPAFGEYAVKVWEPHFKAREEEVSLQGLAGLGEPRTFRVPKVLAVDEGEKAFVMELVPGETVFKAVFRRKRLLARSFYEDLQAAFRELNEAGILHNDAHTLNYMLSDVETSENPSVIVDAQIWIIDFGRSVKGRDDRDLKALERDLARKVAK